jgi:DNA-binding beta-propeller fold protein YncE
MIHTVSTALRAAQVGFALRKTLQLTTLGLGLAVSAHAASPSYYEFESGHVRPLAKSADGTKLFAVNTPNNSLDVFSINGSKLTLISRVPVGLEPVAVAVRSNNEVWVVNHLSDSVSIVSLDGTPRVTRTLLVGDEPRDIVFAGASQKAFITTAHRGQHLEDPSIKGVVPGANGAQLTTPGVGRADVWVFDPANTGAAFGGTPVKIMTFFADTPRALAVSPDKQTLYVASFKSGNQTAVVDEDIVCNGFNTTQTCVVKSVTYPGGMTGPKTNAAGKAAPETGMIVKYNPVSKKWEDELKRDWSKAVPFTLPDKDVFAVDANTLSEKAFFTSVGNTLFNMVANPVTGALYVTNLDVNNLTKFEGPGKFGGSTVQGKLALARVSVIANGQVQARHLNKHLDYGKLASDPTFDFTQKNHSLALPLEMAVTNDGKTLYVTAYGSNKIGVFNTADIERNTFDPRTASANYITLPGLGGPSGVVLDEDKGQMYVMTRFDDTVRVVSLSSKSELSNVALKNPEPANIIEGRPFLYDAFNTSANGEASCASCHIFGEEDATAWNLGNPDDEVTTAAIPGKYTEALVFPVAKLIFGVKSKINGDDKPNNFHPMKGPMMTQTLHGMRNSGAMHWRGDRATGLYGKDVRDSNVSFLNFGGAFQGLIGAPTPMSKENMQKFADYQLNTYMPPNAVRNLDNSLTTAQANGLAFYTGTRPADGINVKLPGVEVSQTCNGCHTLDPAQGLYGTGTFRTFEGLPQTVKVAPLRNLYQRVGMFGAPSMNFFQLAGTGNTGEQVRGYGFTHDGAVDTIFRFFHAIVFRNQLGAGFPAGAAGTQLRADMEQFMLAFDGDLAPIVGQQITLNSGNGAQVGARIDLLIARAKAPFVSKEAGGNVTECDLVASVVEGGTRRGLVFDVSANTFVSQDGSSRSDAALRALAKVAGQEVTYTCTPPGTGRRVAFDS